MTKLKRVRFANLRRLTKKDMYIVEGILTESDVNYFNSLKNEIILIFKNTKNIDRRLLEQFNDNITISILGGLDYINKAKYSKPSYINRTLYSPKQLSEIIEYFENIEKNINSNWTDTQKSLYLYNKLASSLHYKYDSEHSYENGEDVVRSLKGLLYGKLVCSGFALVFKEAMDRLEIPSIYQNKASHHSWNIVKLDGHYRGIELTRACYNKDGNIISPWYFGMDVNFYEDEHHDISGEAEEEKYDLVPFDSEEIAENYLTIVRSFIYKKIKNKNFGKYEKYIMEYGNEAFWKQLDKDLKSGIISNEEAMQILFNLKYYYSIYNNHTKKIKL